MTDDDLKSLALDFRDQMVGIDLLRAVFQAGAASRDAEIHRLQMALADTEQLELGTAEKCDQLREQVALLREEVTRCRDWFEAQAKVKSKGGPSSWELMLLRDERDAADEALAATEPKIAKPT